MLQSKVYDEIIDFIAAGATPAQVVAFKPSAALQQRVSDLVFREKNGALLSEEQAELEHYLVLEHILRMAKIRARRHLRGCLS